jgi:hypothetical protein
MSVWYTGRRLEEEKVEVEVKVEVEAEVKRFWLRPAGVGR